MYRLAAFPLPRYGSLSKDGGDDDDGYQNATKQ